MGWEGLAGVHARELTQHDCRDLRSPASLYRSAFYVLSVYVSRRCEKRHRKVMGFTYTERCDTAGSRIALIVVRAWCRALVSAVITTASFVLLCFVSCKFLFDCLFVLFCFVFFFAFLCFIDCFCLIFLFLFSCLFGFVWWAFCSFICVFVAVYLF